MDFVARMHRKIHILHKITISAFMLALVLIFQFLEQFMPLPIGFVKLNFSLIFILPVFYFCGFRFGTLVMVLRMIFASSLHGFNLPGIINQTILFVHEMFAILLMYIYSFIFKNVRLHHFKICLILFFTLFSVAIIGALLNVLIFFPIYLAAFSMFSFAPTISEAITRYHDYALMFFFIPNYWVGVTSTYLVANIIKFSLIFFIYWPLSEVFHYFKKSHHYY